MIPNRKQPKRQHEDYWIGYREQFLATYNQYKNHKKQYVICEEFLKQPYQMHRSIKTLQNWIALYKNHDTTISYKRGGNNLPTKSNDEIQKLLILLAFEKPNIKTREVHDIIKNDKNLPNISTSTIKLNYKKINFNEKQITFVHYLKNCLGMTAMRKYWAKNVKNLIYNESFFPTFVDECGIRDGKIKGRNITGITITQKSHMYANGNITLGLWCLPFIGRVFEVRQYGYTAPAYAGFILRGSHIIKNIALHPDMKMFVVQDNCSIHKNNSPIQSFNIANLPSIPTIQYSPELNGVVENAFKGIKTDELYNILNKATSFQQKIDQIQNYLIHKFQNEDENAMKASLKHWLAILDECEEGYPLTGQLHIKPDDEKYEKVIKNFKKKIKIPFIEKEN